MLRTLIGFCTVCKIYHMLLGTVSPPVHRISQLHGQFRVRLGERNDGAPIDAPPAIIRWNAIDKAGLKKLDDGLDAHLSREEILALHFRGHAQDIIAVESAMFADQIFMLVEESVEQSQRDLP